MGGRYEILEWIGSGGMSDVYKAKCHKLNRYVAVKVLKREYINDTTFVSKFQAEAEAEQTRIAAQAEADANNMINNSITENLIRMKEAEARLEHGWVTVQGADAVVTAP